ncbi:MAG: hypothetical protein ACRDI2_23170, partial [Chloroflexota bacterium]
MSTPMMNALRLWGNRWRAQVEAKLGRCSQCMRASLLGALAATGLLMVVLVAGLPPLLVGGAGVLAAGFGGLVVAHAAAYVYYANHPTAVSLSRPCCGQRQADRRPIVRLQRRPLGQVLFSLPAAFGLAQLAGAPPAAAQRMGTTVKKTFRKSLSCLPCGGECVFQAFFEYDYRRLPGSSGKFHVTRFKMTWDQADTEGCTASIDRGEGAFDFQCVDDAQPCQLTGGNIWQCPCDTRIEFVPLGDSTAEDCTCPNEVNRTAYAQGLCGAPIAVEKACD